MRDHPVFVSVFALMLSSCSSGPPALPEDLVERAATCAVVAASEGRATLTDAATPLELPRQSQIVHYALLAGAADPGFSADNANAVVTRMQALQSRISGDDWKPLAPLCKEAFPEADLGRDVTLPETAEEAQLDCFALGGFMVRALQAYEESYQKTVIQYNGVVAKVEPLVKAEMKKNGVTDDDTEKRRAAKNAALVKAAKLGPPAKVMDACVQRFPPDTQLKLPG
jgi:hypothetical protein